MNIDLPVELRDMGDKLAADYQYRRSTLAYQAAHTIEHMERKIKDLEDMLEDAEHFREHWYDRYLELSGQRKPS